MSDLNESDSALDAFCMSHGTRITLIDEALNSIPDSNPNKGELQRLRSRLEQAHLARNGDAMEGHYLALIIGLKAAVHTIPLAIKREKFVIEQRRKASLDRGRIVTDNERTSITAIIKTLAFKTDALGDYLRSNEVWPELFSELHGLGLVPNESNKEYTFDGGSIKYGTFKVLLSDIRTGKR